ncbi:retrovirus-related pol polyprotein from transposon TNT 1-94 [Tanacetum coccineum]
MHKRYCLVITDDYSKFTWVFFLATKDETSEILKNFIIQIENLVDQKIKIIRCDNGTEFKNKVMDNFCKEKGIRRENGVAERRNRTLIEAVRTMLADSKLPTTFCAEAVSTACYVQNRVFIIKPHNKTPFRGIKLALSFMKPFGCHVTILNTLDSLGKFDGKSDEENKPMIEGNGPKWLFDIDSLAQSMNYVLVTAGTSTNESSGTQEDQNAGTFPEKGETSHECIMMPIWKDASYFDSSSKDAGNDEPKYVSDDPKHVEDGPSNEDDGKDKSEDDSSTKQDNTADQPVDTASPGLNTGGIGLNTVGSSVNTATCWELLIQTYSRRSIDYDEVFAPVARIKAIRLFLAYASFMDFIVYQMDVKSAFLYGQIEEEVFDWVLLDLTSSMPDVMFAVCASVGFRYSRDSPFELVAYTDNDYDGATQDRKSTTGGYLLTKGFDVGWFQYLVSSIGMVNP